jgi:hypothetical protein
MSARRVLAAAVLATAAVSTSMVVGAGPASAKAAPTCLDFSLDDSGASDSLWVYNACGRTVHYNVVLAFATDFPCTSIRANHQQHYSWFYPGRFDGLKSC